MGLSVEVTHGHTGYALRVNHAEVTLVAEARTQAIAQAITNFLVEFNPSAYVPTLADAERMIADPSLMPVGVIEIPDESALPPFVQADADDNVGGLLAGTAVEP